MIIELGKYNEIGELLIENRTAGSQGHVSYQDGGWRASVTMAAVYMGVEEMGIQTGHRCCHNLFPMLSPIHSLPPYLPWVYSSDLI